MKEIDFYSSENNDSLINEVRRSVVFLLTVKASVAFFNNHGTFHQGLEIMKQYGYTAMPVFANMELMFGQLVKVTFYGKCLIII